MGSMVAAKAEAASRVEEARAGVGAMSAVKDATRKKSDGG
jgi:hypothetical protein